MDCPTTWPYALSPRPYPDKTIRALFMSLIPYFLSNHIFLVESFISCRIVYFLWNHLFLVQSFLPIIHFLSILISNFPVCNLVGLPILIFCLRFLSGITVCDFVLAFLVVILFGFSVFNIVLALWFVISFRSLAFSANDLMRSRVL